MATFEGSRTSVLEACFNNKRRHRRLIGHRARTFDFQFHPTEGVAISASEDGTARLWDLSTSKCTKTLEGRNKKHEVLRACWAPSGSSSSSASVVAATGTADGIVRMWGMTGGEGSAGGVGAGHDAVGAERYGALQVVGSLQHRDKNRGFDGQVYSCQFLAGNTSGVASPDDSSNPTADHLLTASDCSVHLWDVASCQRMATHAFGKVGKHSVGGGRNPTDISFVFDAKPHPVLGISGLAVALSDGTVRIGNVLGNEDQTVVLRARSSTHVTSLAWSGDGTVLATCGGDGTVTLWDARTWKVRSVFSGHSRPVYGAAFFPTSQQLPSQESSAHLLLSWSSDGTICAWDATRACEDVERPLVTLRLEQGFPIYSCAVRPDGRQLAVAGGGDAKKTDFLGVPIKVVELVNDSEMEDGTREMESENGHS